MCYIVEGFILKYKKEGVSFVKWLERGRDSLGNREKGRVLRAK